MRDFLFATPWWAPTCMIGIGIVLFISGNKRQQARVRNAGVVAVLLALVLLGLSYFVETDKEKVARHTRELVADVENRQWDKMKSLLSPRISLSTIHGTIYPSREVLLKGAEDSVEENQLKSATISSLEVEQTQTLITASMTVWTVQDATMGKPIPSGWQLLWEQDGNDWVLTQITCISIGNESVNNLASHFAK